MSQHYIFNILCISERLSLYSTETEGWLSGEWQVDSKTHKIRDLWELCRLNLILPSYCRAIPQFQLCTIPPWDETPPTNPLPSTTSSLPYFSCNIVKRSPLPVSFPPKPTHPLLYLPVSLTVFHSSLFQNPPSCFLFPFPSAFPSTPDALIFFLFIPYPQRQLLIFRLWKWLIWCLSFYFPFTLVFYSISHSSACPHFPSPPSSLPFFSFLVYPLIHFFCPSLPIFPLRFLPLYNDQRSILIVSFPTPLNFPVDVFYIVVKILCFLRYLVFLIEIYLSASTSRLFSHLLRSLSVLFHYFTTSLYTIFAAVCPPPHTSAYSQTLRYPPPPCSHLIILFLPSQADTWTVVLMFTH